MITDSDNLVATFPGPRASRPHTSGENTCRVHRAWHHRGYLPHFDAGAVVQMITFRLADSLPRDIYEKINARDHDDAEKRRQLEETIDSGRGSCLLRDPEIASIVECSLRNYDGEQYCLICWVIMPNHVHLVIEQIDGFALSDVIRGWKSFSAKQINKLRKTSGSVWAPDYFDRFIRDRNHFSDAITYTEYNPVKAGLASRPEEWPHSSAAKNAGGTPAVPGKNISSLSALL
jgi:REP element-mobilizing transposase RayT